MFTAKVCTATLLVWAVAGPVSAQYMVGDRLVVIHDAKIKVGDTVVEVLGRGQDVRVDGVNGNLLQVKHLETGWINRDDVTTPATARDIFLAQISRDPLDAGAFYACGTARTDLNDIDLAIEDFNAAIRLLPNVSCAYNGRGVCWQLKGESDKALADYTEAIRLDPQGAVVTYFNRSTVWTSRAEYAKAVTDATEALRLAPTYINAYSARAQALVATKQFDKAIADCDAIRNLTTAGLAGYNDVAWFLSTTSDENARDAAQAILFAKKACDVTGWSDAGVLDTLAVAYASHGLFDQAMKWERKAIELSATRDRIEFESRLVSFQSGKPYRVAGK